MILHLPIKTKDDLDELMTFVTKTETDSYKKGKSDDTSNKEKSKFKEIVEDLKDTEVSKYQERLSKFGRVTLVTPFKASNNFLGLVYDAFKQVFASSDYIIESEVDPRVKSGAKVFFRGTSLDLTLKSAIVDYLRTIDATGKYL